MVNDNLNWNSLAAELSAMLEGGYEGTAVDVVLGEDNSIEIYPAQHTRGTAVHYLNDVVDFCRCKRLNCYASYCTREDKIVPYIRIF